MYIPYADEQTTQPCMSYIEFIYEHQTQKPCISYNNIWIPTNYALV